MAIALTESEFQNRIVEIYREEQLKVIQEKWDKLSGKDKRLTLEMLKLFYPEKAMLISESKWYNSVMDVLGIFDPTPTIDIINGISYWRQGDKLFAILSWISAVPYVGDAIGKTAVGVFKVGGFSAKAFKAAALAGDAAKMGQIAKKVGPLEKLVTSSSKWIPKILDPLKKLIGKIPGVGRGLVKSVEDFTKLFTDANKIMKSGAGTATKLTAKKVAQGLSKAEARELKKALKQATGFRGFRDFKGNKNWLQYMKSDASLMSKLSAGAPRLWGNPATRSLMRRTKWYLGLLDHLGIANFVGPEELENQVENLDQKVNEYSTTTEAQNLFADDVAEIESESMSQSPSFSSEPSPSLSQPPKPDTDPFSSLLGGLFA
jgi:hypothetical protein